MNAVIVAVTIMLALSVMRVNVVLALFLGALAGGISGGLDMHETLGAFTEGLGGGAGIALSYALLGAFAVALSRSGVPEWLAEQIIKRVKVGAKGNPKRSMKYGIFLMILLMAFASQNIVPVHIAIIPVLIPPLLAAFAVMNIDRRQIACLLTFGLTATYMLVPIGFGNIYLMQILGGNLQKNGLDIDLSLMPSAMTIPVGGMFLGLLFALFVSYRKPRHYASLGSDAEGITESTAERPEVTLSTGNVISVILAIVLALGVQLYTDSMALGAASGFITILLGRVISWREADEVFTKGLRMMAICGFIMIAAAGFAEVLRTTGDIPVLVNQVQTLVGGSQAMAALMMLLVGLLITMGIGSSFSTVPIIATLYVPLALSLGFSPLATAALVGTAGGLGDAGSPASDSTIGPTAGLNADGQHDHIRDTVIPTFLHYNLPMIIFGWIAAMVL